MYKNNHLANSLRRDPKFKRDRVLLTRHPERTTLTYGAFFDGAEKMAAALVKSGVQPGDRIAVQAPKSVAMLELYVASVLAGAVFLPLNPAYTAGEVAYFLGDATPRVFVCDPRNLPGLSRVATSCGVSTVWTLAGDETGTLIDARDAQRPGFDAVDRVPTDLAAILYTSGTTGRSKGAMLSHRALASNSETLRTFWRFTDKDVLIHALPIFHTHGLFVATNITLMAGGAMIFLRRFDRDSVMQVMPDATAMMGVPTFYTRLLDSPELGAAARNMRLFVSGSAPLLAETHAAWKNATGHDILERYGMTETNMNTSNPYIGPRRAGTVGLPLPGVEVKVCAPDTGHELAQGEAGILEVRGDNVFSGYWNMPTKTAEELRQDGYFITGDIASIGADGYVTIIGRAKDLIISGGLNVYPKEIEALIDALPGVVESAVIGVAHPDLGEAVVAIIVLKPGGSVSKDQVFAGLSEKLARFKQPKKIIFERELPRNTMGKVQKNALRERHADLFKAL